MSCIEVLCGVGITWSFHRLLQISLSDELPLENSALAHICFIEGEGEGAKLHKKTSAITPELLTNRTWIFSFHCINCSLKSNEKLFQSPKYVSACSTPYLSFSTIKLVCRKLLLRVANEMWRVKKPWWYPTGFVRFFCNKLFVRHFFEACLVNVLPKFTVNWATRV